MPRPTVPSWSRIFCRSSTMQGSPVVKTALGAGHLDRRIEDEREHLVHHALRPERAQAEQLVGDVRDLARREPGGGLIVDEGAVQRVRVGQHEHAVGRGDLGVLARDVAIREVEVGVLGAADRESRLRDVDDAAVAVGDDE
jgi:hypothetical protein